MNTVKTLITPELARVMLATQVRNRILRKSLVKRFCDLLKDNKFETTHQGIAFDKNGCLIDGQHRLHAIIESGISVYMLVTRGLDPDIYFAIDGSTSRRMADLIMPGQKKAMVLCEMATATLRVSGLADKTKCVTTVQTLLDIRGDDFKAVVAFCGGAKRGASIASIRVAAAYMYSVYGQYALECYSDLVNMRTEKFSPVMHAFNRWVIRPRMIDDKDHEKDMFARAIIAFNPENKALTKIQIKTNKKTGKPDYSDSSEQLFSWAFNCG